MSRRDFPRGSVSPMSEVGRPYSSAERGGGREEDAVAVGGGGPASSGAFLAAAEAGGRGGGLAVRLVPIPAVFRLWFDEALRSLADTARDELDGGLVFPLLVAVFALGIALYFVLPAEPWAPATIALAAGLAGAVLHRRHHGHRAWAISTAAVIALGVAVAAIATLRREAPRLDHERTVTVEGRVTDVDTTQRGGVRMGVEVARMEGRGLTPATTPTRIAATLTLRGGHQPQPGDAVRFKARLKPPEGPVLPGGYDFAQRAWFDGRGASGYVLGRLTPIDLGPPPLVDRLLLPVGVLRHAIAERVREQVPGATGQIGAALMVGEQRAIPESVAEPLRASGLTHIVSISGLHMSLVAGGVIVAMRLVFVLFPVFALRFPVKKWAAGCAIVAATIYLLLSGNQIAALRSHLMLTIALIAVMVDRPAITMHTVAVSAVAILVWDPSQAMEPSFLMSYLAVIALVASYDLWRLRESRRPPPRREPGPLVHGSLSLVRHVEGMAFSSLVAGLATAPVIAGIFYRGAPYSILANMIVLPVTSALIMPAAVVAALLMPFGLDGPALWAMGLGIDFMIAVARWTASLPAGGGWIGLPHPAMMPLGILAVLWLSLWRSRIRLFGLVPAVVSALLLFAGPRPDVFVGRHGSPVAVRDGDGRLHVLAGRQDRFDTAIWLAADADTRPPDAASLREGWTCDGLGCAHRLPGLSPDPADDLVVAVVRDARAFPEDCRRATLVVSALEAPPGCAETTRVIDRVALARTGATILTFTGDIRPGRREGADALARDPDGRRVRVGSGAPPAARPPDPTSDDALLASMDEVASGAAGEVSSGVNPSAGSGAVRAGGSGEALSRSTGASSGRNGVVSAGESGEVPAGEGGDERNTTPSAPDDEGFVARVGEGVAGTDDEAAALDEILAGAYGARRDLVATASLPASPRPWTPRDPTFERRLTEQRTARDERRSERGIEAPAERGIEGRAESPGREPRAGRPGRETNSARPDRSGDRISSGAGEGDATALGEDEEARPDPVIPQ